MNVQKFIEVYGIEIEFERVKFRPGGSMFDANARHYKVNISNTKNGHSFTSYYSLGPDAKDEPDTEGFLETIGSDCLCTENSPDWADFLIDLGYVGTAQDIRRGYEAWKGCNGARRDMTFLVGEIGYEEFLEIDWEYEYEIGEK